MTTLRRATRLLTKHPARSLVLTLAAVIGLVWWGGAVRTDNSLSVWFVKDDPALVRYEAFLEEFGNDETVVVGYEAPRGVTPEELDLLRRTAERIGLVDGVARVVSPASFGLHAVTDPQGLAGRLGLVGEEGAVGLVVFMEPKSDMDAERGRIIDNLRSALNETLGAAGREVHLAGTGVLYDGLNRQTERDATVFLALAIAVMTLLLWITLGRWQAVLIVLSAPLAATALTTALVALTGQTMNVVMATLPALLLVIGLADGVHIFLAWYRARRNAEPLKREERRALSADVVAHMAVPCLFTSVTTALGFLALTSSRMGVIRELGMFAAVGVLLVWVLVLVACATGLALLDVKPPRRAFGARLAAPLTALAGSLRRRRIAVVGAFGVAFAVLGFGAARITVDTHTLGLLPEEHPVRADSRWIEQRLGLYTPLEFVIRTQEGSVLDAETLRAIRSWQYAAEERAEVGRTYGITNVLELADTAAFPPEIALGLYTATTGDDLAAYLTPARDATRITALVPMGTAREFATTVAALEESGHALLAGRAIISPAGYLPLYVRIIDYTVSSTLQGLALALGAVFLVLGLLLRSWRLLLVSIPPNLFSVATVFGIMGWAGIPLDIATATVGAIVLGIAVDDTVHFLHRYREARLAGSTDPVAVALAQAGPAIVLTSLILALGLGVLLAAGSLSIVYFGLVSALAVLAALVADLLLLPVLLPGVEGSGAGPRS